MQKVQRRKVWARRSEIPEENLVFKKFAKIAKMTDTKNTVNHKKTLKNGKRRRRLFVKCIKMIFLLARPAKFSSKIKLFMKNQNIIKRIQIMVGRMTRKRETQNIFSHESWN